MARRPSLNGACDGGGTQHGCAGVMCFLGKVFINIRAMRCAADCNRLFHPSYRPQPTVETHAGAVGVWGDELESCASWLSQLKAG